MLEPIYIILIVLIGGAAFWQEDDEKRKAAMIFAFPILVFDVFRNLSEITPFWYYIIGGMLDSFVIAALLRHVDCSNLRDDLLNISVVSILLNGIGFGVYGGQPDTAYRVAYLALYVIALYALLGGGQHGREYREHSWFNSIRLNAGTSRNLNTFG